MTAVVRSFEPGDLAEVVDGLGSCCPAQAVSQQRFAELFLLDAGFDPAGLLIAEVGGQFAGSILAIKPRACLSRAAGGTGWVCWFFVLPGFRGARVGTTLLDQALGWLSAAGVQCVEFGSYPGAYLSPGLDVLAHPDARAMLQARGFATGAHAVAMRRCLGGYRTPEIVLEQWDRCRAEGYRFGPAQWGEVPEALRLVPQASQALRDACRAEHCSERLLLARDRSGRVVGLSSFGVLSPVSSSFGPIGVHPAARRIGLGRILLHLTLSEQVHAGARDSWFDWVSEDGPAGKMFAEAGFTAFRRVEMVHLDVEESETDDVSPSPTSFETADNPVPIWTKLRREGSRPRRFRVREDGVSGMA